MNLSDLIRSVGLRRTETRQVVLNLLHTAEHPLTHQEIAAHPEADGLDRVTLYRTLAALQQAGLVHRVQGLDGSWRFCFHSQDQPGCPGNHPHFLCLRCGGMCCLHGQSLPQVSVQQGVRVMGKQLVAYGHCLACADNADKGERRR